MKCEGGDHRGVILLNGTPSSCWGGGGGGAVKCEGGAVKCEGGQGSCEVRSARGGITAVLYY